LATSGMVTSLPARISSVAARTMASWVRRFWLARPVVVLDVIAPPFRVEQNSKSTPMMRVDLQV
jgi:hypothetical protein